MFDYQMAFLRAFFRKGLRAFDTSTTSSRRRWARLGFSCLGGAEVAPAYQYLALNTERLEERRLLAAYVADVGGTGASEVMDVAVLDNGEILAVANMTGSNGAPNGAELLRFDSSFNLLDHQQICWAGWRRQRSWHFE